MRFTILLSLWLAVLSAGLTQHGPTVPPDPWNLKGN
jgi:hypothetical protein